MLLRDQSATSKLAYKNMPSLQHSIERERTEIFQRKLFFFLSVIVYCHVFFSVVKWALGKTNICNTNLANCCNVFTDTNWNMNRYNHSKNTSFHFTHHIAAVPYPITASYTHYKLIMQKLSITDRCRWYVASKRQKAAGDSVGVREYVGEV